MTIKKEQELDDVTKTTPCGNEDTTKACSDDTGTDDSTSSENDVSDSKRKPLENCGRLAKPTVSSTSKCPKGVSFYLPKGMDKQQGNEVNARRKCHELSGQIEVGSSSRKEMMSRETKISVLQSELNRLKKRVMLIEETDLVHPVNKTSKSGEKIEYKSVENGKILNETDIVLSVEKLLNSGEIKEPR